MDEEKNESPFGVEQPVQSEVLQQPEQVMQTMETMSQPSVEVEKNKSTKEVGSDGRTIEYASFWIRLWASILDNFFSAFATYFGFLLIILAIGTSFGVSSLSDQVINNVKSILVILYFILMTYKYQATVGKQMAGVRVVSMDGGRATLGSIVLRETVGKFLSFITVIGIFMPLFTKKKQALHDKIAGTIVVYS